MGSTVSAPLVRTGLHFLQLFQLLVLLIKGCSQCQRNYFACEKKSTSS